MNKSVLSVIASAIAAFSFSGASAVELDLSGFPAGSTAPDGVDLGVASLDNFFSNPGTISFFDSNFIFDRVFCFDKLFSPCGASGAMNFDFAVQDITFLAEQTSTLSNFSVEAFSGGTSVATRTWDNAAFVNARVRKFDFTGVGPITSLIFSGNDFRAFGKFTYNEVPADPIPLPAAPLLFLTGAGVLAGLTRRRSAR
ncbi:MAG: VPLPA-CTERM sorting domain-containing protein [Pseudomonadota bacterium]